ncbi:peptide ABC transporter substrate-binding protein [Candidatus Dojkabacteria bacterium]|uniref:Peptide ABC transporter substrate-binding protein n=1 Tax=Candidatus Dojkabacteria bacterium TaxID=2099670 RepID=A0A955L896_9BACT|nr:peptide ABC transporter substrate-binding protein [Candidatus Dojkabacteria bacterium]
MKLLRAIENAIYTFRNALWDYPDFLLFDQKSVVMVVSAFYKRTRPFSHLWLSLFVYLLLTVTFVVKPTALLRVDSEEFIEGSVVGIDETGQLLGLQKINPLVPSTIQLEKDISNLVYESLLTIDQNAEIHPVLIESYEEVKKGNHYSFTLKNDIYWHDGTKLTTHDVEETFELLQRLNENPDTASSFSSVVANQFNDLIVLDDRTFEVMLVDEDAVLPTFFESLTFKIMPAKYIENIDTNSILTRDIYINTNPIGTGPYRNVSQSARSQNLIQLSRNERYHEQIPSIGKIVFQLFPDENSAVEALKTGKIHAIAGLSSGVSESIKDLENYEILQSNIIYNQYWALHFNLDQNSGHQNLQEKGVRQAIGYAIDRDKIINNLDGRGEEAFGTIPKNSFAYNDEIARVSYNPEKASELLDDEGWRISRQTGLRTKQNSVLSIDIVYVDNIDRDKVAENIKDDLEALGIEVNLIPETVDTVNNAFILTKNFDILLYGLTTFIDVDRYELYHSSQIGLPSFGGASESTGLNISSYISEATGVRIENQEQVDKPKVDILLEEARAIIDEENRKDKLFEFQEILNEEMPTVFLYHPRYVYVVNNRVSGVNISFMNNLEDRFANIEQWDIKDEF